MKYEPMQILIDKEIDFIGHFLTINVEKKRLEKLIDNTCIYVFRNKPQCLSLDQMVRSHTDSTESINIFFVA